MSETRPHTDSMVGLTTGSLPAGTVLGSYRVLGALSSGSMGMVFRAEHLLLGRPAAVKLLRQNLTSNPELVQRFVNEAKAVTASKHPGIVEVYDFGYTPDGHAFIVMELLEGEPLGQRLARLPMSEPEAVAIALGIASALKAAHKVGVIHRDLKPDNVFLVADPDGGPARPKVLDFGIAKLADPAASGNTETGALIGTPLYMAPEQARAASAIDHRADLYSLGCLLYHMLVGRPPFVAEGGGEIIALQMFGEVEPPSRLATITPEMNALVLQLLEKDPAQRPGSAADVMTALAAIDAALTAPGTWRAAPAAHWTPPAAASSASPPQLGDDVRPGLPAGKRSRMPIIAAVVTVLAIAGVAIAFLVARSGTDAPAAAAAQPTAAPTAAAPPAAAPPAASPPAASPPAAAPTVAAPGKRPPRKPTAARATDPATPASGPVTRTGDPGPPDRTIEVIRDIRQVEPPVSGPHTRDGSPMETTVDPSPRPRPAPPADPPATNPDPPKDDPTP